MDNKLPKSRLAENIDDRDSQDSDFAEMNNQDESVNESVDDSKNTTRTAHYQQYVTASLPKIALDIDKESIFESDIKGLSEEKGYVVTEGTYEESHENQTYSQSYDFAERVVQDKDLYKSTDVPTSLTCSKETAHEQHYAQAPLSIVVARNIPESKFEFDITRPCEIRITGIAVIELDRLVLCNNKGRMLFVYNTFGKYLQEVALLASPFDIAVLSDNKTAVVSFQGDKYIQRVTLSPTSVSSGDKIEIRNPCTGGITAYNECIAVGVNRGIEIYTTNGQFVNSVKNSVENISYLKYAQEKCIYTNGIYYIRKEFEGGIPKLILKCFGTEFQRSPLGIALACNLGNGYIADFRNDNILKVKFGIKHPEIELSHNDGIYGPRALCVNSDVSKLFIANNDGQSIYIHCLKNN